MKTKETTCRPGYQSPTIEFFHLTAMESVLTVSDNTNGYINITSGPDDEEFI